MSVPGKATRVAHNHDMRQCNVIIFSSFPSETFLLAIVSIFPSSSSYGRMGKKIEDGGRATEKENTSYFLLSFFPDFWTYVLSLLYSASHVARKVFLGRKSWGTFYLLAFPSGWCRSAEYFLPRLAKARKVQILCASNIAPYVKTWLQRKNETFVF